MKFSHFPVVPVKKALDCHMAFGSLLIAGTVATWALRHHPAIRTAFLLVAGWLSWTYIEYVYHRFWSHGKDYTAVRIFQHSHAEHHAHPSHIRVTGFHRAGMLLISLALIAAGWHWPFMMLLSGLWTGFSWFCLMHYFLHQSWSRRLFPELAYFHLIHHCRRPDLCFGVSTTLWDKVFGTAPAAAISISTRIRQFYFVNRKGQKL